MEKVQILVRRTYPATAFLLSLERRQCGELIFLLKNNYAKQQRNYPRTLLDM